MKKFILLPLLLLVAMAMQAQNDAISRFFSKYQEDEAFTSVYVSPKMFQLIAKIETDDPDWNNFRDVLRDLGGLRVLTSDSISNGVALYNEVMSKLPVKEYEELLTVRDGQENVRFWVKESGDVIEELLLVVSEPTEFTMLSFTGRIDLQKIASLSKTLDVDGMEHLEKIKGDDKGEKGDKGNK
jgi:hypothetical protein